MNDKAYTDEMIKKNGLSMADPPYAKHGFGVNSR